MLVRDPLIVVFWLVLEDEKKLIRSSGIKMSSEPNIV